MINEKSLLIAAKELVNVLGLIDEDRKEIKISESMTPADLAGIIKKAIPLIDPKTDKFEQSETLQVIKEFKKGKDIEVEEESQQEVAEKLHEKNVKNVPIKAKPEEEEEEEDIQEEEEEKIKPKKEKPIKNKNITGKTKKSIVEEMISMKVGATIEQIATRIVDEGIDDDYKKNLLVVKLWLAKMGFSTTKASIEKNPIFKKK